MYTILLSLHSVLRWLVLASLLCSIYISYKGYVKKTIFTWKDDAIRHWTATIAHIQLVVGFTLYIKSPIVQFFWRSEKNLPAGISFFGWIHILFMLLAIVVITIGSAKAKRKKDDQEKFKTMLIWFGLALFIIFLAIPWPFSPFVTRPYIRPF